MFGSTQTDDSRDEERIQTQMILDVEAFGKEAQFLGIEIEKNEHYVILKNIVLAHDRMFFTLVADRSYWYYFQKMHHKFHMFRSLLDGARVQVKFCTMLVNSQYLISRYLSFRC